LVLDFLSEAPTPAVKKAVKAGLAEFEKHKKTLLGQLSRSRSFDQEKCWLRLNRLAQIYFLWQAMPHAAKREADLRKLAETLGRASRLAEKVRQDNVGSELVSHLIEGFCRVSPAAEWFSGKTDRFAQIFILRLTSNKWLGG
jgi:hypothetical protein